MRVRVRNVHVGRTRPLCLVWESNWDDWSVRRVWNEMKIAVIRSALELGPDVMPACYNDHASKSMCQCAFQA